MKTTKKFCSALISAVMMLSCIPAMAAVEGNASDGNFIIADFSKGTDVWNASDGNMITSDEIEPWNNITPEGEVEENTYTGMLITPTDEEKANGLASRGSKTLRTENGDLLDFTNVKKIHFWIYNPVKNDSFSTMLLLVDASNKPFIYKIMHNFSGWKLITIDRDSDELRRAGDANWEKIHQIWFYTRDWPPYTNSTPGTKLYFGKIWTTGEAIEDAQIISETHPDGSENVSAAESFVAFELNEDVFDGLSSGKVKIIESAQGEEPKELSESEYNLSYEGATVRLEFLDGIKRRRNYQISIDGVYTVSGGKFSVKREFSTEGYKTVFTDKTVAVVADFADENEYAKWKSNNGGTDKNLTYELLPEESLYDKPLGRLMTHYDGEMEIVKGEYERYLPYNSGKSFSGDVPSDWSDIDYVNILMYVPEAVKNSRFQFSVNTNYNKQNSYFHCTIYGDKAGWQTVSIPKNSFKARDVNTNWSSVTGISLITADFGIGYPKANELFNGYIQKIWTSKGSEEKNLVSISIKDGEYDVPANEKYFSAEYNEMLIDAPYAATATLYKYAGTELVEVSKPSVQMNKGSIRLTLDAELEKGVRYLLSIGGITLSSGKTASQTIEFVTENKSLYASKPVMEEDFLSGDLTVKTTSKNETGKAAEIKVFAQLFDAEGNRVAEKSTTVTLAAGDERDIEVKFSDVPTILYESGASDIFEYSVAAFAVNTKDLSPLWRHTALYPDGTAYYEDEPLANSNVKTEAVIRDTKIEVKASFSEPGVRPVIVTVKDGDGKVILVKEAETDSEGIYEASVDITSVISVSGEYTVSVNGYDAKQDDESFATIFFADNAMKKKILDSINAAEDADEIENYLKEGENGAALGIKESDYKNVANTLSENKEYKSFSEISEIVKKAVDVLKELNETDWINLSDFVSENKDIILNDIDFESEYFKKSATVRNSISKFAVKECPYESFVIFREVLENAIDDYKESQKKGGSSGGGGGSKISSKTLPSQAPISTADKKVFYDLDGYSWAESAIISLYENGIVSGKGNGSFNPSDSVTREGFVKMLTETLKIPANQGFSGFIDSSENAWYDKYLGTAKAYGIINGREDGSFGVGSEISRQDMAVMLLRAVNSLGLKLENVSEAQGFSDEESISTYAVEAVKNMQQKGMINGMGDGSFAPGMTATRAQAAVIIKRLLEAVQKGGAVK